MSSFLRLKPYWVCSSWNQLSAVDFQTLKQFLCPYCIFNLSCLSCGIFKSKVYLNFERVPFTEKYIPKKSFPTALQCHYHCIVADYVLKIYFWFILASTPHWHKYTWSSKTYNFLFICFVYSWAIVCSQNFRIGLLISAMIITWSCSWNHNLWNKLKRFGSLQGWLFQS